MLPCCAGLAFISFSTVFLVLLPRAYGSEEGLRFTGTLARAHGLAIVQCLRGGLSLAAAALSQVYGIVCERCMYQEHVPCFIHLAQTKIIAFPVFFQGATRNRTRHAGIFQVPGWHGRQHGDGDIRDVHRQLLG